MNEKKTPKAMPFMVMRDYWTEDGERVRKGTIAEMTADDALEGIESGNLERVKK